MSIHIPTGTVQLVMMVCSTDLCNISLLFSLQIVRVKDEMPWLFPFLIGHVVVCSCCFSGIS